MKTCENSSIEAKETRGKTTIPNSVSIDPLFFGKQKIVPRSKWNAALKGENSHEKIEMLLRRFGFSCTQKYEVFLAKKNVLLRQKVPGVGQAPIIPM